MASETKAIRKMKIYIQVFSIKIQKWGFVGIEVGIIGIGAGRDSRGQPPPPQ